MKNIIILLRVPFVDKIPSLKTLIIFLASSGYHITIISSRSDEYPKLEFVSNNISLILVKQRTKLFEFPTSVKLFFVCLIQYLIKRPSWIIGGDGSASYLLYILSRFTKATYVNFMLEYPELGNNKDYKSMKGAKYIITHDVWHRDFIHKNYKIDKRKFLLLPNASHTPPYKQQSDYLQEMFNIKNKNIILHSGGLGKWFCSKELAKSALTWDDNNVLIFHTSHHVETSSYYQELIHELGDQHKILFSIQPVSNCELDKLVASSYIGLALYSIKELSYRALYMGLAAGKIGNYLKCGIPVIATKLPSLTYLEEYECGVLVNSEEEIKDAINLISERYDVYSRNCYQCYYELWEPTQYLNIIKDVIEK